MANTMKSISFEGLNTVINNMEEGVMFLDKKRSVVAINAAAIKMVGRHNEELVGTICLSLFQGTECARECNKKSHCSLLDIRHGEQVHDISLQHPDGKQVLLRMWALPLPGEQNAECAVVLRNRTHERKLEEEVNSRMHLGGLLGHSRVMQRMFKDILRLAPSTATVLIQGESGTGKELVAHAIHDNSTRADAPYIRVHCAALAESLLESELFGHAKGAFTGAIADRQGRFEAADGGTLLLDEIGEISPGIQVKLLRVLQEREVERLGENKVRKVDVRLIAATNRNLGDMVGKGEFRQDLFYRLRVLPLYVPALRERLEDVSLLASHMIADMAKRYGYDDVEISGEALAALGAYEWPGNVRELGNALEFAMVHSGGATIVPRHLPPEINDTSSLSGMSSIKPAMVSATIKPSAINSGYYRAPAHNNDEKSLIIKALERSGGNKAEAARILAMSRTTLWKRLKKYGLI